MAMPAIRSICPATGPTAGGDVVRITGSGFAAQIAVLFDDVEAEVLSVRDEGGISVVDVHTPAHAEAVVDVTLRNLDGAGTPVPGEEVVLPGAYRFLRPRIVHESDLTRLVRGLLRELKQQIIANVSMTRIGRLCGNHSNRTEHAL